MGFTFHCACMLCFPPAVAFSSCVKRYTHQTAQDEPSCMYEASKQQRTREAERTVNIQDILPSTLEASLTAQIKTSKQYQKHKVNHFNYLNSSSLYLKLANGGGGGELWEREAKATHGLLSLTDEVQALITVVWEPEQGCEGL